MDNFSLDWQFIAFSRQNLLELLRYTANKYMGIVSQRKEISYLGNKFRYDNVFTPALLQAYPKEILKLDEWVDFEKIKTILDIGANIGQFAYTLKHYFPHLSVYSFEPNKNIIKILKSNLKSFKNTSVYPFAIDEKSGKKSFFFIENKTGQGSFYEENAKRNLDGNTKKIVVESINLNKQNLRKLKIPQQIDLVKIDVEGYEFQVIKSLKNIKPKYVFFEYDEARYKAKNLNEVLKIMEKNWGKVEMLSREGDGTTQNFFVKIKAR